MAEQKGKCPSCGAYLINAADSGQKGITYNPAHGDSECKNCGNGMKIEDFVCLHCGSLNWLQIIFWIALLSIFVILWGALVAFIIYSSLKGNQSANFVSLLGFGIPWLGLLWWLWKNIAKLRKAQKFHNGFSPQKFD
jgi:ribosomal protein L32